MDYTNTTNLTMLQRMLKRLRKSAWLVSGLVKRYHRIILTTFIAGLILVMGVAKLGPWLMQQLISQHKVIGIVGSYTPSNLPIEIQRLISSGLTDIAEDGSAIPAIATSWDISEDGKVYTFHLRNNLVWHDGKAFNAHDVNYNLKDVDFVPKNDTTLIVKLKEPFTPLPNFLAKPLFRKGLIGLGSYKITSIRLKGDYVSYLKLDSFNSSLPQIEIKFFHTEIAAKTAFKLGEVNTLDQIVDASIFSNWSQITITPIPKFNQFVGLFFDVNDPLLKTKEIRQGLAYTIEKNEKYRSSTPLSSKSWAYTTRVKQYDKDAEQAKDLLPDANSTDSAKLTISTFPQFADLAESIAAQWKEFGVTTDIKIEGGIPSAYQVLLISQEIPSDPDQYMLWHSTQTTTNLSHYANPKIDKLLEDGRKELDREKRKKIYFDLQRYLVEDAPAVFLYHPILYTVSRN